MSYNRENIYTVDDFAFFFCVTDHMIVNGYNLPLFYIYEYDHDRQWFIILANKYKYCYETRASEMLKQIDPLMMFGNFEPYDKNYTVFLR